MTQANTPPFLLAMESFSVEEASNSPEWTFVELNSTTLNLLISLRADLCAYTRIREFVGNISDFELTPGYFPGSDSNGDSLGLETRDLFIRRDCFFFTGYGEQEKAKFEAQAIDFEQLLVLLRDRSAGVSLGSMTWLTDKVLVCSSLVGETSRASLALILRDAIDEEFVHHSYGEQVPVDDLSSRLRDYLPSLAEVS